MWEKSFVGVSMLLGASYDDARAMVTPDALSAAALDALGEKARDPRRAVRAQALATVAQEIVVAIDEVTLR